MMHVHDSPSRDLLITMMPSHTLILPLDTSSDNAQYRSDRYSKYWSFEEVPDPEIAVSEYKETYCICILKSLVLYRDCFFAAARENLLAGSGRVVSSRHVTQPASVILIVGSLLFVF
ncbi:hypothetical protein BDR07DRAFT_1436707 [Suillus spraguei]|nr:hypothetical protein BDR07DRAFT_1436707 [Suillus spraguei]